MDQIISNILEKEIDDIYEIIEFMRKIFTEEILMFDENGDDWSPEYEKYVKLEEYLIKHPEFFILESIPKLLELFNDFSYSINVMDSYTNIVSNIIIYYKEEGVHEYFNNIDIVTPRGRLYGKYMVVRNLLHDDYELLENAIMKEDIRIKEAAKKIIKEMGFSYLNEKKENLLIKL